jgi:hypothetical protein
MNDVITRDITPLTAGQRLRNYMERRETALAIGLLSSAELITKPVAQTAIAPTADNISHFLRKRSAK